MANDTTRVTKPTREEEAREAEREHAPDLPRRGEDASAKAPASVDPDVARHEKEMAERGAHQEGEGRVP